MSDRDSVRVCQKQGSPDTFERAKERVTHVNKSYQPPTAAQERQKSRRAMLEGLARTVGLEQLPETEVD